MLLIIEAVLLMLIEMNYFDYWWIILIIDELLMIIGELYWLLMNYCWLMIMYYDVILYNRVATMLISRKLG
jgi:hypothetical protein